MQWPDPGHDRPYRARELFAPARWTQPPLPVSRVPKGDGYRARHSLASDTGERTPQPYYWCRSCNRLTRSERQAFCDKHRPKRDTFMRRTRDAETRLVPTELIDDITTRKRELPALWAQLRNATDSDRATAQRNMARALKRLDDAITLLDQAPAAIPTDDLDDDDFEVN